MKKKWWIFGCVALAAAVSLCFFGVRVRIAPRLILTKALGSALQQVDDRFENSPVHLLTAALDSQGRQQAQLKLETEEKHIGTVVYDMHLHTQLSPNRIFGTGSVITGGKVLDISLFLDEKFAAVSSDSLISGNFYGITYDTFSQDIRDRQLLAALLGQKTIGQWEEGVAFLQEKMSIDLNLPEVKPEYIRTALYGSLTLKSKIEKEAILLPAAGDHQGYGITFRATGAEICDAVQPYREQLAPEILTWIDNMSKDPESNVRVKFSLYKGKLIQILAHLDISGETVECLLYLGENPVESTISMELNATQSGEEMKFSVMIRTEQDDEIYEEVLHFAETENSEKKNTTVKYHWDLSSRDMDLEIRRDGEKIEQRLNLTGEGECFTIRAENIRPLLNYLLDKDNSAPAICTLTVAPGTAVVVPEYRNLDQWSVEDLLILLEGLGGLLGITLP